MGFWRETIQKTRSQKAKRAKPISGVPFDEPVAIPFLGHPGGLPHGLQIPSIRFESHVSHTKSIEPAFVIHTRRPKIIPKSQRTTSSNRQPVQVPTYHTLPVFIQHKGLLGGRP